MKPKTIILMVIAIACGLGASYMTSQLIANRGGENNGVEEEMISVLVAKKKLDQGLQLKDEKELFETKEIRKKDIREGTVTGFAEVKDKFLKGPIRQGDSVLKDDVSDQNVNLNIPPGYKAVGLRVSMETIAGGWASLPGSRVDLLWTYRSGSDKDTSCVRLLENVLVLAADGTKNTDGGNALPAQVVILALKGDDVLKLALAKDSGTMSLTVRNPGDTSLAENQGITMDQLKKSMQSTKQDPVDEPAINPDIPVIVKNDNLPDPNANFQEYKVKITDPTGTRTVTFLKNKITGKWVSDISQPSEPAGDFAPVGPLDQAVSPSNVKPTPRQEEPAPRKETNPLENPEGF
jgi:pilus assembly protein CpaB